MSTKPKYDIISSMTSVGKSCSFGTDESILFLSLANDFRRALDSRQRIYEGKIAQAMVVDKQPTFAILQSDGV